MKSSVVTQFEFGKTGTSPLLLEPINPYVQNGCNNTENRARNPGRSESPAVLILTEIPPAKHPRRITVYL
jgi:hypothetical protein